jgi:flagellar motility protein MotE (MotC chaperone)
VTSFFKRPRLLPIVMVAGLALLTLKGAGLLRDAQAAENAAAPVAAAAEKPAADPAQDDPQDVSTSEVDVLTSLSKRRAELDAREQDLAMRANLIAATEQRVDGKIAQLKAIQTQLTGLLQQRDAAQQKQVDALVKTYSSMKAKDAARIFNSLDEDVRLSVAQAMKPDVLAPILAAMDAETAQKLTVTLANHLKLPAEAAPAPTLASLAPPPSPTAASPPVMADQQPAAAATTPAPQAPQQSADASANPPAAAQAPANPPATPAAAPAASTAH